MGSWFFSPQSPPTNTTSTPVPEASAAPATYTDLNVARERQELERLAELLRTYPDLAERIRDALELPDE